MEGCSGKMSLGCMLDLSGAMARQWDLNFSMVDFAQRRCKAVTCSVFGSVFCSSSSLMSQRGTQVWAWWTISPLHPRKDPIHEEEKKKSNYAFRAAELKNMLLHCSLACFPQSTFLQGFGISPFIQHMAAGRALWYLEIYLLNKRPKNHLVFTGTG